MALSKDAIFSVNDSDLVEFSVPEWDGTILLRSMSGKQRNDYEHWASTQSKAKVPDYRGIRERLIINCVVDENGEQLFSESDIAKLSEKNSEVIDRIHTKCRVICGMDEDAVEDAVKN
jgi:hypothetical protein